MIVATGATGVTRSHRVLGSFVKLPARCRAHAVAWYVAMRMARPNV